MNAQQVAEPTPEVEQLVDALVDGKLAAYLLDSATANELIKEIAAETGLPRAAVRIAFKLLAPLLVKKAEATASWFGRRLLNRSSDALTRLPGYAAIATKLLAVREKLDRDARRRHQLDAILAGERPPTDIEHAEGLSQELRLGLLQLVELDAMNAHIDARFDELLARLNPQPPLDLKLLERSETNRLKFGARRVPFIGREAERGRLREFLETTERFTWWLVTGSGGQGKSRLAMELCLRTGPAWRAGFLPETSNFDAWYTWQPESATLIVVDYVATRAEKVRGIITSLRNRAHADPLDAPVRLLLLERSKEQTWWSQLITSDQTGYALEQCQFAPGPLDLGPVGEHDLWQHVVEIVSQANKPLPDRAETLAALAAIDPERRPLYAAFAADALMAHGNIRGWDQARLLRDVLARERSFHWQPAGVTKPYENLLCLATMTGGLSLEILAEAPAGIELPDAFDPPIYGAMSGVAPAEAGDGLPALQPDILGEFFVLEHLKPSHRGTKQPAEGFRRAAWERPIGDAYAFATFLDRAKDDFLVHPTLPLLVAPPSGQAYQRHFWAMLAVNLINAYGNAGRLDDAAACLDLLKALEGAHPAEAEVRLRLAQGAFNLITAYGNAGRLDDAAACLDLLKALEGAHPAEAEVRLELAKAAVNLITAYGNAGRPDDAAACLDLLKALEGAHPAEAEVRLCLAQGAFNLITAYGNAGHEAARALPIAAKDALMSAEFAALCREQFGEEVSTQVLAWLRSLLEP